MDTGTAQVGKLYYGVNMIEKAEREGDATLWAIAHSMLPSPTTFDRVFDGSDAHELCSACAGTGKVLDGEICRFCDGRGWNFSGLQLAIETLEGLGYSDMAEAVLNLCNQVYAAPVAIMDTRDVLGICAPTEDAFPALYALQGKRVRLVLDQPPNVKVRDRPPLGDPSSPPGWAGLTGEEK